MDSREAIGARRRALSRVIAFVVALFTLVGCGEIFEQNSFAASVDPQMWSRMAAIKIPNSDTLSKRTIELFVRHQPMAKLDTIELSILTTTPSRVSVLEDVTLVLDVESKHRRGAVQNSVQRYREDVVWSEEGDYRVHIYPKSSVVGVEAVGVKIIKD